MLLISIVNQRHITDQDLVSLIVISVQAERELEAEDLERSEIRKLSTAYAVQYEYLRSDISTFD